MIRADTVAKNKHSHHSWVQSVCLLMCILWRSEGARKLRYQLRLGNLLNILSFVQVFFFFIILGAILYLSFLWYSLIFSLNDSQLEAKMQAQIWKFAHYLTERILFYFVSV